MAMKKIITLALLLFLGGNLLMANPFFKTTSFYYLNANYATPYRFEEFVKLLKHTPFDEQRLKMANIYVQRNPLFTVQINKIAKVFQYDNNRLTFTKLAYKDCRDPQNYPLLRRSFTFTSNFNQLLRYIAKNYNSQYRYFPNNRKGYYQPDNHHHFHQENHWHNDNNNCNSGYGWGRNAHYHHHRDRNNYGYSQSKFNQIIAVFRAESFDSNRLKSATLFAKQQPLKVVQIKQITDLFTFDSNRLKFAKSAYQNCIDKQNYILLRSSFDFASNFNDLLDYIKEYNL